MAVPSFGCILPTIVVTSYGCVRLTADALYEIVRLCGHQWWRRDMRTKAAKLAAHIESDIEYLAQQEWIAGGDLTEL